MSHTDNIERVEWTLRDPEWRPSREYVEKMLAAYREVTAKVERLKSEADIAQRAINVTQGLWQASEKECAELREEIERLRNE